MHLLRAAAPILPMLAASPAFAHGGHAEGFAAGLAHPLLGPDHLVAMVAVGIWAARARAWAIPAMFLGGMALGIAASLPMGPPGMVGPAVAGSLLALGLIIALAIPMPAALALPAAGLSGLVHGMAHGGEVGGGALATALGMVAASATLHAVGCLLGYMAAERAALARAGGAGIAAMGATLLLVG